MMPSSFRRMVAGGLALCLGVAPGCADYVWWEYRDDPYLADASGDETAAVRMVNGVDATERQVGLRVVAERAAEARRRGDAAGADRLEQIIIRRYGVEKDTAVRACIVRICGPAAGRGSRRMVEFLRSRIAAGEFPGYAALALADLGPRTAFQDIEPLTRHPDVGVRVEAAEALLVLGDGRGYESVCRVWRGMTEGDVRDGLAKRAVRIYGQPLR